MRELNLPTDDSAFSFTDVLDERAYTFDFWWNTRTLSWYLSLTDAEGVQLVSGVRLSHKAFPLARLRDLRLPPGALYVLSMSDSDAEPTLESLGRDTRIIYYSADDLLQRAALNAQEAPAWTFTRVEP